MKPAFTVWVMGPTSSGKTTIATSCCEKLHKSDKKVLHFDGDEIRELFGPGLGFSEKQRNQVVQTLTFLACKANEAGINVVVSALTAHQSAREFVEKNIPNLKICYINCPIDVCVERDPKGLYGRAIRGEIDTLIGYNSDYIPPSSPDIIIDTSLMTEEQSSDRLCDFILSQ